MDNRYGNRTIKDIKTLKAKLTPRSLQSQAAQYQSCNPGASFEDALRALKAQEYENDLLRRAASEQAVADRMDQQGQVRDLEQGLETSMGQNEILSAQLSDEQKQNIALIANAERTPNMSQKRRAGELVAKIPATVQEF